MRQTHTFAVLHVSDAAYQEIAGALRDVGYDHAFLDDGLVVMSGIAIAPAEEADAAEAAAS